MEANTTGGTGYDSTAETLEHIEKVRSYLKLMVQDLGRRAELHDRSKLEDPEKSTFDKFTPKLKHTTYGSEHYVQCLREMGPALTHHYANNRHHPEYYANGMRGMSLLDVMEMLADWYAASQRHADGNLLTSIRHNQIRFGYSDDVRYMLINTAVELGWIEP